MSILNNIKMPILPKLLHKCNTAGLPRWCSGEYPPAIAVDSGDMDLIPGLGRSPGVGYGKPFQYSSGFKDSACNVRDLG